MEPEVVAPLAQAVAVVGVPGAAGVAADAASFAGAYATATRVGAAPVEGQRIYEVAAVKAPVGVDGSIRVATVDDVDLLTGWIEAFWRDTGAPSETDGRTRAAAIIDAGRYEHPPVGRTPRIGGSPCPAGRSPGVAGPRSGRRSSVVTAATDLVAALAGRTERLELWTLSDNIRARRFYERSGFILDSSRQRITYLEEDLEQVRYVRTRTGRS